MKTLPPYKIKFFQIPPMAWLEPFSTFWNPELAGNACQRMNKTHNNPLLWV